MGGLFQTGMPREFVDSDDAAVRAQRRAGQSAGKELGAIIDTASMAFPKRLGEPDVAGANSRTG